MKGSLSLTLVPFASLSLTLVPLASVSLTLVLLASLSLILFPCAHPRSYRTASFLVSGLELPSRQQNEKV